MPLINCPECDNEISDTALKCPKCGVQLRKPTRGIFGKIFKWVFIIFNLLMLAWLISYWGSIGELVEGADSDAAQAGAAIGATIGTGMLFGVWVVGDIILGLFVMFTRPKS